VYEARFGEQLREQREVEHVVRGLVSVAALAVLPGVGGEHLPNCGRQIGGWARVERVPSGLL
jgi:hypothetical protein